MIAEIHSESKESAKAIEDRILASYEFSTEKIERGSVIIDTIVWKKCERVEKEKMLW